MSVALVSQKHKDAHMRRLAAKPMYCISNLHNTSLLKHKLAPGTLTGIPDVSNQTTKSKADGSEEKVLVRLHDTTCCMVRAFNAVLSLPYI